MTLQLCLNGARSQAEHPAVPHTLTDAPNSICAVYPPLNKKHTDMRKVVHPEEKQ